MFTQRLRLFVLLLVVLLGIALTKTAQAATTITVNTLDGELNNDGDCSLHEAIEAANTDSARDACPAGSGADIINFSVTGGIYFSIPLPHISQELIITGPGADKLAIDGNDQVAIIDVAAGVTVTLNNLTIADGYAAQGSAINNFGSLTLSHCVIDSSRADSGVIINGSGATLDISHCTVLNNRAVNSAGAIYNEGRLTISDSTFSGNIVENFGGGAIFNRYSLTINRSTFRNNSAKFDGGAILNDGGVSIIDSTFDTNIAGRYGGGLWSAGAETLQRTIFTHNEAGAYGGGIAITYPTPIHDIIDCTFSQNKAGLPGLAGAGGGAYFNRVTLTLMGSTFSQNESGLDGGGIYNEASVTLIMTDSMLSGNQATRNGGGFYNLGVITATNSVVSDNSAVDGGGIYNSEGTTLLTNTTLHGNKANGGDQDYGGGGILNSSVAHLIVKNSTLSNNQASYGAGIENYGSLTVINSTFSGNNANFHGGGIDTYGPLTVINSTFRDNQADGLYNGPYNQFEVILRNTILVNNSAGSNCINDVIDGGHNLDSGNSCGFSTDNGSLIDTDPKLGPLANNGGATQTHALQPGSPAIDAGDDIACADPDTVNRRDQRGVERPQGVQCDMGAFELELPKEIEVLPATIQFPPELAGSNNPSLISLTIRNARTTGSFAWSAQTDAVWLQVSPAYSNTPASLQLQPDISTLSPGFHTANVVITSTNLSVINRPFTVPVTIQIVARNGNVPILRVSQPILNFQTDMLAGNPDPLNFLVDNLGGGVLNWQASVNSTAQTWLTLDHSSGVAPAIIKAKVNIAGLSPGTYVGAISVTQIGSASPPFVVNVLLSLQPGPTISLNTAKLIFVGRKNQGNPPAQPLTVQNSGAGAFNWQTNESIDWLTLDPNQGAAPATIKATATTAGLNVGVYREQISVSSATAAASPAKVDIVLGILTGAILDVKPNLITFDTIFGSNPAAGQIVVRNVGEGNLEWAASEELSWLSLEQSSGTIQGHNGSVALRVNVNSTLLAVGSHKGQITFTSSNGDASPQTVNVLLTVASPVKYCNLNGGRVNLLEGSRVKLSLENVNITNTETGCHLSGALRMNLPQNANLTANLEGDARLDAGQSVFNGEASAEIILEVANMKLKLGKKNVVIREQVGLTLDTTGWDLPPLFGGGSQPFTAQVTIGLNGISIAGQQSFAMPNLQWGNFSITQNKGSVAFTSDGNYQIDVSGKVKIVIPGTGNASSDITLKLDKQGIRTGSISSFTMAGFAGLDLVVLGAQVESNRLFAKSASLKVPKAWGGLAVVVYDLVIEKSGSVRIGGGEFELPNINAGGDAFQLGSLKGRLVSLAGGGYEIQAKGMFGMSGLPNGRSCRIWVDITVQTGPNNSSILTIQSAAGQSADHAPTVVSTDASLTAANGIHAETVADGLRLKKLTVGVHCQPGWPVATTGFFLTGVEGSIELSATIEQVSITVWIESKEKVDDKPLISAVPKLTIHPDPFALDFNAPIYLVGFETARTKIHIDKRSFAGEVNFNFKIVRGGYGLESGRDRSGDFYLRGSGWGEVYVEKGALLDECITYPSPTLSNPGRTRKACFSVPDSNQHFGGSEIAFDLDGIDAKLRIAGYKVKAHYDFDSGRLSVGRGLLTSMVTSAEVEEARKVWEARLRGETVVAAVDERITFATDGSILVTVAIEPAMPLVQATDVITPYAIETQRDVVFGLVQPPTGTLQLILINPAGQAINPDAPPSNIHFQQSANVSETVTLYIVAGAATGNWQTKLVGDTSQPYGVVYQLNTPPPTLNDLKLVATGNPNQVQAEWRLFAGEPGTTIKLYAQSGPLTSTVTYTNADEKLITQTTPLFAGTLLAENLTPDLAGNIQSQLLDLSKLPSAQYHFWIEAVGIEGGFTRCFIRLNSTACDQSGINPVTINVDHAAAFPSQWATVITTENDSKLGELLIQFQPNSHPDVDNYMVRVRTAELLTPTAEIVNEYGVGPIDHVGGAIIVSNIAPGHTYYISIGAQDSDSGRLVWSQEHEVTTPQPEFLVSTVVTSQQVVAGTSITVPILLDMASDLPYPVAFTLDYDRLPDGIYVSFDQEIIQATTIQTRTVASISASTTLLPGDYVVPILAHSGLLEHTLNLLVRVELAETQANNNIYLPLISR